MDSTLLEETNLSHVLGIFASKLLLKLLTSAFAKAEKEINIKYAKENADFLIKRLRAVIKDVNSVPHGKTLAIFISKFAENVYFFTPTRMLPMPSVQVD